MSSETSNKVPGASTAKSLKPREVSIPFAHFSKEAKEIIKKGLELAKDKDDKRFKALLRALEDALLCVEEHISRFEFKPVEAAIALEYDVDYTSRSLILVEIENLIEKHTDKINLADRNAEMSCLKVFTHFTTSFVIRRLITYTSVLHQCLPCGKCMAASDN